MTNDPITMIGAARNSHSFSMIDIERLTRLRLTELGAEYCKKAFEHSLKFAEDYRISDNIMIDDADEQKYDDEIEDNVIINENYGDEADE
jgi:hypothetical protein